MHASKRKLIAFALAAALASPAVFAEQAKNPAAPGQGGWWKTADANADGKISVAESAANAGLKTRFSTIDKDMDGFVTADEYRNFYTSNASKGEAHASANSSVVTKDLWQTLDANADARVSLAEAKTSADITGAFTDIDLDSDGFITQAEYRAYALTHK